MAQRKITRVLWKRDSTASCLIWRFVMLWPLRLGSLRLNGRVALAGVGICLVGSLAACTAQTESPQKPIPPLVAQPALALPAPPETSAKPSKTVRTSYQGSGTAGQPTASGEPYNPNDLTAASRNLPIGSTVKVTNPDTGRSVKVRINESVVPRTVTSTAAPRRESLARDKVDACLAAIAVEISGRRFLEVSR